MKKCALFLFLAVCLPSQAATVLAGIAFSEIFADPNSTSTNFDTDGDGVAETDDEFLEFTNIGPGTVDLSGWQVYITGSSGQQLAFTFPSMFMLASEETIVLVASYDPGPVPPGFIDVSTAAFSLGNGGDSVALLNPATNEFIGAIYNGVTENFVGLPAGATQLGSTVDFGNDSDGESIAAEMDMVTFTVGTPSPGTSNLVPEPGVTLLAALGVLGIIRRRR